MGAGDSTNDGQAPPRSGRWRRGSPHDSLAAAHHGVSQKADPTTALLLAETSSNATRFASRTRPSAVRATRNSEISSTRFEKGCRAVTCSILLQQ